MDLLTGFACVAPLVVPVGLGIAIWIGVREGQRAKAKVAELAQVLEQAGFEGAPVAPWFTTTIEGHKVWVKAMPTAAYKVIGDAPNSLKLGRCLVCLVPVSHAPIGGMVYPARGHHEDPDFETAFVHVGTRLDALSAHDRQTLMATLGRGRAFIEFGDHDAAGLFPPAGAFDRGMLLRSTSQETTPEGIQAWLAQMVALSEQLRQD